MTREFPGAFDEIVDQPEPMTSSSSNANGGDEGLGEGDVGGGDAPSRPRDAAKGGTSSGPRLFRPLPAFLAEYEPPSYNIDGVVRSGSLYALTAKTGHGKTSLLVSTAFAIATGNREILGADVVRGRVAYVAVENPDDLRMRMMMTAFRFNIAPNEIAARVMVLDRRWRDAGRKVVRLVPRIPGTDFNNLVQRTAP